MALFLAFARLSVRDIKNGIYAVIFLMPLYLIRFSIFGIPTTALEIMIYILFGAWLLKNRKRLRILESIGKFYESDKLLAAGAAFLFFGVILSTLHSSDLRTSLGVLKGWFFDPFIFFIIFVSEIKNQKHITDSLLSHILSGFVVALIGITYAINGSMTFDGRLRAIYESPNYLAMYVAPAFLFAAYFFIFGKDFGVNVDGIDDSEKAISVPLSFRSEARNPSFTVKLYKYGWVVIKGFFIALCYIQNDKKIQAIILLFFAIAIYLTKSYGALLGIAAALSCFLLKKLRDKNTKLFSDNKKSLTILAVVALCIFSFFSLQKYEQLVNAGERSSFASRIMIWSASLEMLKDSPVFGIGPGTFQETYLDYQSRFAVPYLEWAVPEPHNTFLAFYLQSGLIGFVGFILILIWLLKKARTSDIVFLFLVYFLIHGLVDTLYWKNDFSIIFWLVVGIGSIDYRIRSNI